MGPLAGFRIIEMAGIGPAPFAATLLSDMGAEVIRIDRREAADLGLPGREPKFDVLHRGRRSLAVDLKTGAGCAVVKRLAAKADALIEGFRPGVMERLGLSPEELIKANPRLVVGRMTGFGQDGPMAQNAGHDINYIALAGVLHAIGRKGEGPVPPLNLVGDFGGGGMFLAFGVVCALLEAQKSGKGQVVDAAMVDGAAYLAAGIYGLYSQGTWADERGVNVIDSGAPWYDVYKTKDGKWLSVGAIEKRFYAELVEKLGLGDAELPKQHDRKGWPELRRRFTEAIAGKTRAEWETVFAESDACVAPVLSFGEVEAHPHNKARTTFHRRDGVLQPGPAPRYSRTRCEMGAPGRGRGVDSEAVLGDWGYAPAEIAELKERGVVGAATAER
jgi:alpha-methylacyl-CoA racemase